MNELGEREQAIVEAALKLAPKERAVYLDQTCPNESELRRRVLQAICDAESTTGPSSGVPPAIPARDTIVVHPQVQELGERAGDEIGPYKLLEKIGEGGMGSVWVAEQRAMIHRKVALKVIKLGMDTKQVIARFEAERQALAFMEHPSIAKVLDAGATEKGRPFFVMEFVKGVRITDYCDLHKLSTRERLQLFVQVCKAVGHAHQKGIIHRDIKPPNILVAFHDNRPAPVIIDFGIAKAIAGYPLTDKTVHTEFEEFIGTPAYMSPEQAEMNPLGIDFRTDIYALGVLLYELLTGMTPFDSDRLRRLGTHEIRRIIREEDPPRPSTRLTTLAEEARATVARQHQCDAPQLIGYVRGDLDWIVMKCLEKDRTRRYDSADALAADVERYLAHQPIVARPASPLYRVRKLVRRHRPAVAAAAVTLAAACVAALGVVLFSPDLFSRSPPTPQQRLARATALLKHYDQEGAIPKAMFELNEALKAAPNDPHLWSKLGWANWLLYGEDQQEETRWQAWRCSSNALTLGPYVAEAHLVQGLVGVNLGDWVAATNHLLQAKELTRSANAAVLIALASACQANRDRANAKIYADKAEEVAGDDWHAWDRIGFFQYKSRGPNRDLIRAGKSLERAVQLAPDSPLAHRELGYIFFFQTNIPAAAAQFARSLALRRTPQTLSALGTLSMVKREYNAAVDKFSEASKADPANFQYRYNLGLALSKSGREADAIQCFTQALQQTSDRLSAGGEKASVLAYQGLYRAALGQQSQARQDLERAESKAGLDMSVVAIIRDGYKTLGDAQRVAALEKSISQNSP